MMQLLISSLLVAVAIAAPLPANKEAEETKTAAETGDGKSLFNHLTPLHYGTYVSGQSVPVNTFHHVAGVHSVAGAHSVRLAGTTGSVVSSVSGDASAVVEPEYKGAAFAVAGVPTAHIATHGTVGAHVHNVGHLVTHSTGSHAIALKSAAVGSPAVAVHSVGVPNLATHAVNTVALKSAAVAAHAPAAAVHNVGVVHSVAPAVVAVPSAVTYQSEHTVALPAKNIDVHVQHKSVHVPVEQRVHYGVKNVVTGSQTSVVKPTLNVPAIKAPEVFVTKTHLAAPEVTLTHSEVTVENKSPNYVNAPYDAGVVVEKVAPKFEQTHVPTPVEVAQPYLVAKPYAVPVPHQVKIKSSVKPVHHIDVHSVNTENVVTPIEYADHHHVVSQPVHTVHAAQQVLAVQPAHAVQSVQLAHGGVAHGAHVVHGVAQAVHGVAQAVDGVAVHGAAHTVQGGGHVYAAGAHAVPVHGLRAEGVVQQVHGLVKPAQGVTYTSHGNAAAHLFGHGTHHNIIGANQLVVQQHTGQAHQTQYVKQFPSSHTFKTSVSAPAVAPAAVIDGAKA